MGSYYYLMAQLPYLVYEQKPPMTCESFLALADNLMSKEDSALLRQLSIDPDPESAQEGASYKDAPPSTGCIFIDKWREWERTFRLNLAKHRASHLKRESVSAAEPPYVPQDAASTAAKAVNAENSPLEGEIIIDKARWNAIEELAGTDYFSRNQAFAYYLKLLLLERRQSFNVDSGFSEYKSLYNEITENAHNSLLELK